MNTPKETISLKYEIAVTNEDIDDIMCIALEGGITPMWCTAVKPVGGYLGQFASEQISRGGKLEFIENDGSSSFLTKSSLLNAIGKYLHAYPEVFKRAVHRDKNGVYCLDCANIDAADADAIVQWGLFGEVVYG